MIDLDCAVNLLNGDCLEQMKEIPDNSIDAVVTDPPYGLGKEPDIVKVMRDWCDQGYHEIKGKGFMGKEWDAFVPQPVVWKEVMRVLKPGGYALVACGTRTQDWMTSSLRFAGFEIRDIVAWVYGSGFPKSLDVSKAIDKAAGAERKPTGRTKPGHEGFANRGNMSSVQSLKGTLGGEGGFARPWMDDPEKVEAYHQETAPATEAAKQWEGFGTALKPAMELWTLARKPLGEKTVAANVLKHGTGALNIDRCRVGRYEGDESGWSKSGSKASENRAMSGGNYDRGPKPDAPGRWPANLIHDGSDEILDLFPTTKSSKSAARFFYCAKASKKDREGSNHPTMKPTELMRYLCRLITPPGGVILDPYLGSGSTGKAAMMEGFQFVGIERDEKYFNIAAERISAAYEASLI